MTKLINAIRTKDALTENGMATNSTTLNDCVDLFFHIGAMRRKDKAEKINAFIKAFSEDPLTAMKILFWVRDVRGGAGERGTFRDIVTYLAEKRTAVLRKNIALFPEYGRWDDILVLIGTKLEKEALELIAEGLRSEDGLCAKWMPRPNGKDAVRKLQANAIRKHLGVSPKEYRQLLAKLSTTVEQMMCAKEWGAINFSHVPSKAMSDYMKAFGRNNPEGFEAYLASVEKGEAKINASAVYPYDITKNLRYGNKGGADVQWNALPNYMENNEERVLPMIDTSGSMDSPAGTSDSVRCLDVAISLGLYISERNVGPFQDAFLTFSSRPTLQVLKGTLSERFNQLSRAHWQMNTNLVASFDLILEKAKANNVSESEMPTMIMIISDMQFDSAISSRSGWGRGGDVPAWNPTAQEMIRKKYENAGYEMPKIVYWNLRSVNSDSPVQFNESGVGLVSGFSPALLTNILSAGAISPYTMMMDVIGTERYATVTV